MAERLGSYSVSDLYAYRLASAATFGLDTIRRTIVADLAYWSDFVGEELGLLAQPVTEQSKVYGTQSSGYFQKLDEFGRPFPQKNTPGATVSFPIERFGDGLQFSDLFLNTCTVGELLDKYDQKRKNHMMTVNREISRSLYLNANYTFVDKLMNGVSLAVKRLLNADSALIPDSPAGVTFDGATHQHYLGITGSSVANADIDYLVDHVTEHGNTRGVKLFIALSDSDAISGLTNFIHPLDIGLNTPFSRTQDFARATQFEDMENRFIGCWRNSACEVWVKPYAVALHVLCAATSMAEKVLGYRQFPVAALQGLRVIDQEVSHPLINAWFEHYFGFGVWSRNMAAIMDIGNQATYTNPTFAVS